MKNKLKLIKNVLLISGSGRDCGKTTLACNIISHLSMDGKVYAMKITPHFHPTGSRQRLVSEGPGFKIYQETETNAKKDSSRMLVSGADKVYFVVCKDADLPEVYEELNSLIPKDCPVVCESGSFANVFKAGMHILVKGFQVDETKQSFVANLKRADLIIPQHLILKNNYNQQFYFSGSDWITKMTNHDQARKSA